METKTVKSKQNKKRGCCFCAPGLAQVEEEALTADVLMLKPQARAVPRNHTHHFVRTPIT